MAVKQVFNTSAELDYPTVLPTLDLDFANTKTLDPRITFTRASGGSYVGADGLIKFAGVNEARFDHDPETGESLGLLIEEARTNLIRTSSIDGTIGAKPTNFEFASNVEGQSCVVSTDFDFDGNGRCIKHTRGVGGDNNIGYPTGGGLTSITIGTTYTFSIYVYIPSSQKNKITSIRFGPDSGFSSATFGFADLNILDKWQRVVGSFVTSTTNNGPLCRVTAENGTFFYTDAWQMEVGSFPTSYIPTVASTRTRAADSASITGKNFSEWYNPTELTLLVSARRDFITSTLVSYPNLVVITDGTLNDNKVFMYTASNNIIITNFPISSGGISYTDYTQKVFTIGKSFKAIQSLKRNSSIFGTDGVMTTTDTSVEMPVGVNQLLIGVGGSWGGTISQISYYPKALPPSQLQTLTR